MTGDKIKDSHKTKNQLINELAELRRRTAELETLDTEPKALQKTHDELENEFRKGPSTWQKPMKYWWPSSPRALEGRKR